MALQIHEFNILGYSNIANNSATNASINVELKYSVDGGAVQTANRSANFITQVWNQIASDPDGREILKRHVEELARIRALVFIGAAEYGDFI
jgi:hypothetical protein